MLQLSVYCQYKIFILSPNKTCAKWGVKVKMLLVEEKHHSYLQCVFKNIGRKEEYKKVLHQNDVWHGGKSIAKTVNALSMELCDTPSELQFVVPHNHWTLNF